MKKKSHHNSRRRLAPSSNCRFCKLVAPTCPATRDAWPLHSTQRGLHKEASTRNRHVENCDTCFDDWICAALRRRSSTRELPPTAVRFSIPSIAPIRPLSATIRPLSATIAPKTGSLAAVSGRTRSAGSRRVEGWDATDEAAAELPSLRRDVNLQLRRQQMHHQRCRPRSAGRIWVKES